MPVDTLPAEGHRGHGTFAPPPEGCVGWGRERAEVPHARKGRPCSELAELWAPGGGAGGGGDGGGTGGAQGDEAEEPALAEGPEAELRRELDPLHRGPVQGTGHLLAAREGNIEALRAADENLQSTLAEDEGVLEDHDAVLAKGALGLYRQAIGAFDPAPRLALKAVMNDDGQALALLFESGGVSWDARNAGGQTLLEVAEERGRPNAEAAIIAERDKQSKATAAAEPSAAEPGENQ